MSSPTASEPSGVGAARAGLREPLIRLDDVAVRYRTHHERATSFKEYAIRWMKRGMVYEDLWALRGVSFEVNRGEVVGIIGNNGAGKSTLLKVVARVLSPTSGRVRVRGRVAPLLELGAGFDHELSGRENVFLNGALLGFRQAEIATRFDRIVDFAGLREFIDMPLRTYSTGMVARLGFSVATDATPDILILDEVLAVGDADFQRKSEERMRALRANSQAILLVSHNMNVIRLMCQRVVWLDHGRLRAFGPTEEVVGQYQQTTG